VSLTISESGAQALIDGDGVQLARQLEAVDWSRAWLTAIALRSRQWQRSLQGGAAAWRLAMSAQASAQAISLPLAADGGVAATDAVENVQAITLPLATAGDAGDSSDSSDKRGTQAAALRFVAQAELPPGAAYEAHIAASGAVPTRANLHDFFNAAIWFSFPAIKAALNARQAGQIALHGVQSTRGGVRDALTLFDENAVVFACADSALADALRGFDWSTLFVARRGDWGRLCEVWPFGHALLEKLVAPYKAITAHAWIVDVPPAYFDWPASQRRAHLDRVVADQVASVRTPRDFAPLPVLGIPGWWAANAEPSFYADPQVFRSQRRHR